MTSAERIGFGPALQAHRQLARLRGACSRLTAANDVFCRNSIPACESASSRLLCHLFSHFIPSTSSRERGLNGIAWHRVLQREGVPPQSGPTESFSIGDIRTAAPDIAARTNERPAPARYHRISSPRSSKLSWRYTTWPLDEMLVPGFPGHRTARGTHPLLERVENRRMLREMLHSELKTDDIYPTGSRTGSMKRRLVVPKY